jgi:hypothetical protein
VTRENGDGCTLEVLRALRQLRLGNLFVDAELHSQHNSATGIAVSSACNGNVTRFLSGFMFSSWTYPSLSRGTESPHVISRSTREILRAGQGHDQPGEQRFASRLSLRAFEECARILQNAMSSAWLRGGREEMA